jgi:preprotein translocase subunit SecE
MGKKKKKEKKRADRRERAKQREQEESPEEQIEAQEQAADEAVEQATKAEPVAAPERERRAPKPPREEDRDNAWERLKAFLREVDIERKKINWPAIDETWRSTWVTVVVILFLSGFMGLASYGFSRVAENLFGIGRTVTTAPANVPTSPLGGALTTQPPVQSEEAPADTGGTETPSGE